MDSSTVVRAWQRQLEQIIEHRLKQELAEGHGFQVVLFVKPMENGRHKVRYPKWTVTGPDSPT